jgi:hypothetical protein
MADTAMHRKRLAQAELLDKIGQAMREPAGPCADCLPRALAPLKAVAGSANWQLVDQDLPCAPGCAEKLLEVCRALAERYDVDWA